MWEAPVLNKTVKIIISILLALLVLGGSAIGVLYFGFGIDIFDQSGWHTTEDGQTQYLDYHGDPLVQWQLIGDGWYYFDPDDGTMVTGWLEDSGSRYYLDENGIRQTGWLALSDGTYYISPSSGASVTGWLRLDEAQYYLSESGTLVTGWTDIESARYYFDDAGVMATGWLELDGSRYYLTESGALFTGWLETGDGVYYLDPNSGAMVTGWLETEEGRCYLGEDGHPATGWTDTDEGRFYLDENGCPMTGWLETEEGSYYLDEDGQMVTGWLELDGILRYFQENGTMAVGKVLIDEVPCYFASNGAYVVLVNHWNPVPGDYQVDLVTYDGWEVDAEAYEPLRQMLADCPYYYTITSAYRSEATQQYIWDKRLNTYQAEGYSYSGALALVEAYVAVPGTSEHHLGLAIDISGSDQGCQWLGEHCWEYGFILRYPEGKSDITGIAYERWHFRYVGKDLAAELNELGLCLEEYMDMLTEQAGSDAGTASDPELYTSCYASSET